MKKQSESEIIFNKMVRGQSFQDNLIEVIQNPEVVKSGMSEIWAGLLMLDDEKNLNLLLKNHIYPNEKSEIVHQIFYHYNCVSQRREDLAYKMKWAIGILEKTEEGKNSIVKDIEKYFESYGKVFVDPDIYNFIEPIYQKYATDNNKIYYLEVINQLKFFNTFPKSMFELQLLDQYTIPLLNKLLDTPYWNRLKKIKFILSSNQEGWENFCNKYQEAHTLNKKIPQKGNIVKRYKI